MKPQVGHRDKSEGKTRKLLGDNRGGNVNDLGFLKYDTKSINHKR